MATNFPNSVDSLTNPTTSDTLATVSHSGQHTDANDAIEAIQTALLDGAPLKIDDANNRVGINDTTPSYTLDVNGDINAQSTLRQAGAPIGMVRTMTVGIGSGVTYVDVSNCFSSSYNNYVVHFTVDSATQETQFGVAMKSGTSVNQSGYWNRLTYSFFNNGTPIGAASQSHTRFYWIGGMRGGSGSSWHSGGGEFHLYRPYQTCFTTCSSPTYGASVTAGHSNGIHQAYASYDGFRLFVDIGTITGGRIDVYGMTI